MATTTAPPPRLHTSTHNHAHPQDGYEFPISPSSSLGSNTHRNNNNTSSSSGNNKLNGNMSAGQPHRDFPVQRPAAPSRASSSGRPSSTPMPSSSSTTSATRPASPPPAAPAPPPPPRRMPTHPKHPSSSSSKLLTQSSLSPSHASLNSSSMASTSMQFHSPQPSQDLENRPVKTVNRLDYIRDDERKSRILNHYLVQKKVGNGQHGLVYYGIDMANGMRAVAIKVCRRKNPKDARMEALRKNNPTLHASNGGGMVRTGVFGKLRGGKIVQGPAPGERLYDQLEGEEKKVLREIAIMKKCKHGQVVQLYEVIDDKLSHKIFMVMEFMGGGEIKWQEPKRKVPVLTVDQTRRICRDVVLGLEYLHHQGIIHRDIKPANLLWTKDRKNVKITDFGVSHFSYAQRLSALRAGREWRANASNDPNSQPALSPPSQQGGEIQDEDEASALESLVTEEGESFDPILFDTLHDSAYSLSRQAGTPSFLAPEIVWEYREGILDSLSASAGSGGWVESLNSQGQGGSSSWFGQNNGSPSTGRMWTQPQDSAPPAERQLRTLPTESALGTADTVGQEKAQQQPRSASAGDFSSGPAFELRDPVASPSPSQKQTVVQTVEPSSSTLSSMDIVGDSESDVGGAIRIRTLPPTPLPEENPMEREQELRLRIQGEDSNDAAAHAASSLSLSRSQQQQADSQRDSCASPNASPAPQLSTSASPTPFSPSPSSSSKRPTLQDFPRPPITKSIDVWALGVTLFCLLTGRTPWYAPHEFALFRAIHAEAVVLPEKVGIDELPIPPSTSSSLPIPTSASSGTMSTSGSESVNVNGRVVSVPLGPVFAEKPVKYGPPPPPQDNEKGSELEEDEGEVIVKLLGGLLEKDYRKRWTLEQVKSLAWITRDIPNPEVWLRETSPYLHDPVRVSADEVNVAVTALKFEWNPVSFFRRLKGRLKHGVAQGQAGYKHGMDADLRLKESGVREGRSRRKEGPVVRDYGVQTADKDVRDRAQYEAEPQPQSHETSYWAYYWRPQRWRGFETQASCEAELDTDGVHPEYCVEARSERRPFGYCERCFDAGRDGSDGEQATNAS
ncbi:hypothetical protein SCHPADRAFT_181401 [Schizopora paradoxa]|uniref:Protein kinase domain-containing protein n=1 Tax=Schizopora paradoxa TaxID=27342 RepID=A0A0H2S638_9AGAM|nr:hypothetical protein SCHPADRAFT_181401 [Schizopora paradoxa]